jgi:hypothetical protein
LIFRVRRGTDDMVEVFDTPQTRFKTVIFTYQACKMSKIKEHGIAYRVSIYTSPALCLTRLIVISNTCISAVS